MPFIRPATDNTQEFGELSTLAAGMSTGDWLYKPA